MTEAEIPERVPETQGLMWNGSAMLSGSLQLPEAPRGVVMLAFASASRAARPSTHELENAFHAASYGTFTVDLLTADEEQIDSRMEHYRLDIAFLSQRLVAATRWLKQRTEAANLPIGYFVTSTVSAAAFLAARRLGSIVEAIVSYSGVPDLVVPFLPHVKVPALFLVDDDDVMLIKRNREAFQALAAPKDLVLLDEENQLSAAATLATDWFVRHFGFRRQDQPVPLILQKESDAKGAVESQVQRIRPAAGEEALGYTGVGHEEHSGEPSAAIRS